MATLSIVQMRIYLMTLYNGSKKWIDKVNLMSDGQIYATYHRIKSVEKENK